MCNKQALLCKFFFTFSMLCLSVVRLAACFSTVVRLGWPTVALERMFVSQAPAVPVLSPLPLSPPLLCQPAQSSDALILRFMLGQFILTCFLLRQDTVVASFLFSATLSTYSTRLRNIRQSSPEGLGHPVPDRLPHERTFRPEAGKARRTHLLCSADATSRLEIT